MISPLIWDCVSACPVATSMSAGRSGCRRELSVAIRHRLRDIAHTAMRQTRADSAAPGAAVEPQSEEIQHRRRRVDGSCRPLAARTIDELVVDVVPVLLALESGWFAVSGAWAWNPSSHSLASSDPHALSHRASTAYRRSASSISSCCCLRGRTDCDRQVGSSKREGDRRVARGHPPVRRAAEAAGANGSRHLHRSVYADLPRPAYDEVSSHDPRDLIGAGQEELPAGRRLLAVQGLKGENAAGNGPAGVRARLDHVRLLPDLERP